MKRLSPKRCLLGAALAAAFVLAGAIDAKDARAQGTLIWGMPAGVSTLDPHVSCGWLAKFVDYQIYESLVELDLTKAEAPTELKGQLAESWEVSDDGTVYTFHLRQGVLFHDGAPFNADAVKYNFDRFLDPNAAHYSETANAYFGFIGFTGAIGSLDVLDEYTVQITLKEPNYEWIRMGMEDCPQLYMISPKAIAEYGDEGLPLHPTGTGPFKFVEREAGIKIVLERNDGYWGEKAKLDQIIFRELEDPATRISALRAGEVHVIQEPAWDEIEALKEEGFVISTNPNAPTIFYATFNMKKPVMQDVRVRQAINMAIDRESIAQEVLRGYGRPAYGMLNAGTYASDLTYTSYPYDPEGAKKLLAEAGYTEDNPLVLTYDVMKYGYGELVEKWIQRDLKKVGIEVNLNKMEWLAYLDKWNVGMPDDVEINEMLWGEQSPMFTSLTFRCDRQPPNGWNVGWYCNPEADKIFAQAEKTADRAEAAKLFQHADAMITENDAPAAPLYHYFNPIALQPQVKGFVNAAANWWDLSMVSIAE